MADDTLIQISAFSGLAGAILSQALTGLFAYISDKRKAVQELRKAYREKQIDIAENFYYVTGETMSVLKKSIAHWKDRNRSRSEASISFFNKEIKKLDANLEKLTSDNWKHNLISLYFDVNLSYEGLIAANDKSHLLYLSLLDIGEQVKTATDEEKDVLLGNYHLKIFDLCSQYEELYEMLEKDMRTVRSELLRTFQVK
jgi:hypothetical protein